MRKTQELQRTKYYERMKTAVIKQYLQYKNCNDGKLQK